jgi:hypothetical protein
LSGYEVFPPTQIGTSKKIHDFRWQALSDGEQGIIFEAPLDISSDVALRDEEIDNMSPLMTIVNKATEITLPALAENLILHANHWEDHMKNNHTPQQYDDWKAQVKAYLSEVGYASNQRP